MGPLTVNPAGTNVETKSIQRPFNVKTLNRCFNVVYPLGSTH